MTHPPLTPTEDELERRTIALVTSSLPVPERGDDYGRQVWTRIAPKLAAASSRRTLSLSFAALRPFALAASVLVLVAGAFFVGRATGRRPNAPLTAEVRRRILLTAVGDHLERSRMVLLEYVNAGPAEGDARERARAQELVGSNRLYRQTAARAGETAVADVLDQLERVLLEISNSPAPSTPEAREVLRRRIESEGVLFKIQILGTQVEERALPRPAARDLRS
jgi:hypothetical protein